AGARQDPRRRARGVPARERVPPPAEAVGQALTRLAGGWGGYLSRRTPTRHFGKTRHYAVNRLAIYMANRHQRSRPWGWWVVARVSPDQVGLIRLYGTIVSPRPNRAWRG